MDQTLAGLLLTIIVLLIVLELVRRRRLREEYSLLWILTAVSIIVLTLWPAPLDWLARITGIYRPSMVLVVAVGFFLLLLLYYSMVLTRLADENKQLAQEIALLRQEVIALQQDRQHDSIAPDDQTVRKQ